MFYGKYYYLHIYMYVYCCNSFTLTCKCLSNEAPLYLADLHEINQSSHNLRSTAAVSPRTPDPYTKPYKD